MRVWDLQTGGAAGAFLLKGSGYFSAMAFGGGRLASAGWGADLQSGDFGSVVHVWDLQAPPPR